MKILIIDDNPVITENISLYLKTKGYDTAIAKDGAVAFDTIMQEEFDFLIVDRMMPEIDGLKLIRMLQTRNVSIPFLFLTALSKQMDKIEGLSLGADDYLIKPFDLEELVLRIDNILRRHGKGLTTEDSTAISLGDVEIDLTAHRISRDGVYIELSPKEYNLLEILLKNRGKVLDRDFLYEHVWGDYEVSDKVLETINVHVAHLRKKLGPDIIRTVKLSGYIID